MAGRAAFALPLWSMLPRTERRALVADLAGGWPAMDGPTRERIMAVVREAPDGSGEEIKAALRIAGDDAEAAAGALLPPAGGRDEEKR